MHSSSRSRSNSFDLTDTVFLEMDHKTDSPAGKPVKISNKVLREQAKLQEKEKRLNDLEKDFTLMLPRHKLEEKKVMQPERLKLVEKEECYIPAIRAKPKVYREDYLNKFINALAEVFGITSDVVFDNKLGPKLIDPEGAVQTNLKKLSGYTSKAGHYFVEFGFGLNQNIENQIKAHDINKPLSDNLNTIFDWLTSENLDAGEPKPNAIDEYTFARLQKENLRPDLQKYLDPLLHWMLTNKRRKPLLEFLDRADISNPNHELIKETLVVISKKLIETKIDLLGDKLASTLQLQLPQIVRNYMRDDVAKVVTRIEFEKLSDLIHEIDWTKLIDSSFGVLKDSTLATKIGTEAQLAYAKKAEALMRKSGVIDDLRLRGMAEAGEMEFALNYSLVRNQKKENVIHEVTGKVFSAQERKKDIREERGEVEYEFYSNKADQILELFFPSSYSEIQFWKDQFGVPAELYGLYSQTKDLLSKIISPELISVLKGIPKPWMDEFQEFVEMKILEKVKGIVKERLIEQLSKKVTKFTDPDKLDELMALTVLPKMVTVLLKNLARQSLIVNYYHTQPKQKEMIASLLLLLAEEDNLVAKNGLKLQLYTWIRNLQPHNSLENFGMQTSEATAGISQDEFSTIIDGFVNELEDQFKAEKRDNPDSFSVQTFMDKYYNTDVKVHEASTFLEEIMREKYATFSEYFHKTVVGDKDAESALKSTIIEEMKTGKVFQNSKLKDDFESYKKTSCNDHEISKALDLLIAKNKQDLIEFKEDSRGTFKVEDVNYFFKERYKAEQEADNMMDIYMDFINNLIEMSTLGGTLKTLLKFNSVQSSMRKGLSKSLSGIRRSPESTLNLLSQNLPAKLTAEYMTKTLFGVAGKQQEELRAEYNSLQRQIIHADGEDVSLLHEALKVHPLAKQENELQKNFIRIAGLLQNLIYSKMDIDRQFGATFIGRSKAYFARQGLGGLLGTTRDTANVVEDVYKKIFHRHWQNADNAFKIMDIVLGTLVAQHRKIVAKSVKEKKEKEKEIEI